MREGITWTEIDYFDNGTIPLATRKNVVCTCARVHVRVCARVHVCVCACVCVLATPFCRTNSRHFLCLAGRADHHDDRGRHPSFRWHLPASR